MATPTTEELKRLAREAFVREIDDARAEAYRGRLPAMANNVRTLEARQRGLDTLDPALVQRVQESGRHG